MAAEVEDADEDFDMGCCVPESEMLVVKDMNLDYPWKGGNKYARRCPECGGQKFCAKSYWVARLHDPEETAYVVGQGEDEAELAFPCPYGDCDGVLVGMPESCDECERDIEWEE